jgi:hypothetical protein
MCPCVHCVCTGFAADTRDLRAGPPDAHRQRAPQPGWPHLVRRHTQPFQHLPIMVFLNWLLASLAKRQMAQQHGRAKSNRVHIL